MPAITLKNIPKDLYQRLKRSAEEHHRSLNREAISCLERSMGSRPVDPDAFLARIDKLQARLKLPPITDAEIRDAKHAGRP